MHLTPQELQSLLFGATDSETTIADSAAAQEAQQHLSGCAVCQSVAKKYTNADLLLRGLRFSNKEPGNADVGDGLSGDQGRPEGPKRGRDCPADETWPSLAAGLMSEEEAARYVTHAAQCDWCGLLLKESMEDLAQPMTAEEQEALEKLPSASPGWQRMMAKRMVAASGSADVPLAEVETPARNKEPKSKEKTGFAWWPKLVWAGSGLAVVLVAALVGIRLTREPDVNQLLAQAATERRPFEMRFPGAKFAPVRKERGDNLVEPTSLKEAVYLIGKNLDKNPHDPYWLQANGRALLLEGDPQNKAIDSFKQALDSHPDSPELLRDLGSAYFLGADYKQAIEYLSQALMKEPDDPIALFNRALAYEQIFTLNSAKDDWLHYLNIDSQGEWADEAHQHLSQIQEKLNQKSRSLIEPLLTPSQIAQAPANDIVFDDDQIEEYQKKAITEWLPQAFTGSSTSVSRNALIALERLAHIAKERHRDEWLSDLLNYSKGSLFDSAVRALAAAVGANEKGDYVQGRASAHHAVQLFRAAGNHAGELRAQGEEVYSDHLLYEGDDCRALLQSMHASPKLKHYTWLQAQMSLEKSNCANLVGDFGTYQTAIQTGMDQAKLYHYTALHLRALGFEAQDYASRGDANVGFAIACEGLKDFWSNKADLMKGYNLYTDMDTAADGLRLPHLQVAIWREATDLIDLHPDVLQQAMAHRWYANAAYVADMPSLARAEVSKASSLFATAPPTQATARDRMDAEIWLAQLETRQGDLEPASNRLQEMQPLLAMSPNFVTEVRFHDTLAEIGMRRKDAVGTEHELESAISLAECGLASLNSENARRQWAEQTQSTYRNVVEWKLRQGDAISALELWEWYKGSYLRAGTKPLHCVPKGRERNVAFDTSSAPALPAPTLVAEQSRLLQNQTTVAYAIFRDGIVMWVYDDHGIFSQWVPTEVVPLQERVLQFQRLCSQPTSDIHTLQATARSLYDLLIAPIEAHLTNGRTISFEPDGFLAAVPWDVLVDHGGHYLAERFATAVSPGLYTAMHSRPSVPITPETSALIVSVPDVPDKSLAHLPEVDAEAQAVAFKFSAARRLKGEDATVAAIRQQLEGMAGNGVFHFAGHAVTSPTRNGLVLKESDPRTQKGRLVNADSLAAKPGDHLQPTDHLQLAVLSSCPSGEEQLGASGTEGLVEFLLRRGVPHVIASRWNVDSGKTADFMTEFYARLLSGNSIANSLHSAQLTSRLESSHPYYWAAFELQELK
jgi:CHAT domain-containing protein/tetratricopeptide (TPR) repeat protein